MIHGDPFFWVSWVPRDACSWPLCLGSPLSFRRFLALVLHSQKPVLLSLGFYLLSRMEVLCGTWRGLRWIMTFSNPGAPNPCVVHRKRFTLHFTCVDFIFCLLLLLSVFFLIDWVMSLSKDLRYIIQFANLPSKEARLSARYSHFQISFWTCFSKKCWPVFSLPLVGQCLVVDPWGSSWGFSGLRSWSPTRSSWAVLWRGWDRCLASKACAPPYHGRTLRALEKEREHRKRRRFQLYFGGYHWYQDTMRSCSCNDVWPCIQLDIHLIYIHYIITYVWLCIMQYLKIERSCMTK